MFSPPADEEIRSHYVQWTNLIWSICEVNMGLCELVVFQQGPIYW